jgi:hypothetical protein
MSVQSEVNMPGADQVPCWSLFDAEGLQGRYTYGDETNRTPEQAQTEAFRNINANRDAAGVYIVQLRWSHPGTFTSWYEVGDRVYAPMGEEPDKTPPE